MCVCVEGGGRRGMGGGSGASDEVAVGAESENKTETDGRQRGLERNCLRI